MAARPRSTTSRLERRERAPSRGAAVAVRELPAQLVVTLAAYREDRAAAWSALDALPAAVSARFRRDLAGRERDVEAALRRYRNGATALAECVGVIATARARFAVIVGGAA